MPTHSNNQRRFYRLSFAQWILLVFLVLATPARLAAQGNPSDEKNLLKLMLELKSLASQGDESSFKNRASELRLPNHRDWLRNVFEEGIADGIADSYEKMQGEIPDSLFRSFVLIGQEQRNLVTVKAFEGNCESGVLTQQVPILLARKRREAFYSVQFQKDKKEKTSRFLWFFVFADGQFRYLGTIRIDAPMHWQQSAGSPGERVLVGGDLQKSKLLTQIHPKYPPIARDNGVQGTVRFNALIGTDGRLRNLQLVAGNCYLAEEAARTVRQWQYSPTLLQGKPVEVITTIDVIFSLR